MTCTPNFLKSASRVKKNYQNLENTPYIKKTGSSHDLFAPLNKADKI